jgi:signal transduction histidine kinase
MKRKVRISLGTKFALTFIPLFLFAMLLAIYAVHQTVTMQFTERYERDLNSAVRSLQQELSVRQQSIEQQLSQLAVRLGQDHEFRLYTSVLSEPHNPYIVNYAPNFMATMGLHALEIATEDGVVLSVGQFRNAFGGDRSAFVRNMRSADDAPVLAVFERPEGSFLCIAAVETIEIGNRWFYLIGGIEITDSFLMGLKQRDRNLLYLSVGQQIISSSPGRIDEAYLRELAEEGAGDAEGPAWMIDNYSFDSMTLPVVSAGAPSEAKLILLHSRSELVALLRELNQKIIAITGVGILFIIILAFWQAGSIARPLQRLTAVAENISLETLQDDFTIKTHDEVGVLNDSLKMMVQRLRQSKLELAIAEQKAAVVEVARKVNHDIKNGFLPIRNVMQHWSEVAESNPLELPQVFAERKATVDECIVYLENLAKSYAGSRYSSERAPVGINELVGVVVNNYTDLPGRLVTFKTKFEDEEMYVSAEKYQLRRAIENIVWNSVEAVCDQGTITVETSRDDGHAVISIRDTGAGIPEAIRGDLLKHHITTKADGTGLGLMNAKHICEEFGGSIGIDSEAGEGTCVTLRLPILADNSNGIRETEETIREGTT